VAGSVARRLDAPAVQLHEPAHDGKADAETELGPSIRANEEIVDAWEQLGNDAELVGLLPNDGSGPRRRLVIVGQLVEDVERRPDGGERGPELVTEDGQKSVLGLIGLLGLRAGGGLERQEKQTLVTVAAETCGEPRHGERYEEEQQRARHVGPGKELVRPGREDDERDCAHRRGRDGGAESERPGGERRYREVGEAEGVPSRSPATAGSTIRSFTTRAPVVALTTSLARFFTAALSTLPRR
jgi:hypothetical protein